MLNQPALGRNLTYAPSLWDPDGADPLWRVRGDDSWVTIPDPGGTDGEKWFLDLELLTSLRKPALERLARHSLFDHYMKAQLRLAGGRRKLGRNRIKFRQTPRGCLTPPIPARPARLRDRPWRPWALAA